ncbi:hypothetical protein HME9302_01030 [Alteripontixanthobacter maritimus]|uniref:Uncharacterized protein n=1 Tax=Alteripontixanthobacter maritimus TaxID=2161824 RepID=A0A369Q531_9SPHN|nr:hypothetical protein [Alteripontixanthobacter maritimus]RDC59834.1 hypothetical protein HME9302_01030 [Alteripontixanthobacter maritimus]
MTARTKPATGLLLLFASGTRPNVEAFQSALSEASPVSISHRPDGENWLELLIDGMTFDCTGLSPGKGAAAPYFRNIVALSKPDEGPFEAIQLAASEHLAAGASSLPVMRGLAAVGLHLAEKFAPVAIGWPPASAQIATGVFRHIVSGWLDGGPFPAPGLIAFSRNSAGEMESEGLSYFTGQELHLSADLVADQGSAMRIGTRLVNELVGHAPLSSSLKATGTDGRTIWMEPSVDGKRIMVTGHTD